MVAEARDIDAGDLTSLKNGKSLRDFDRVTVNENLDGVIWVGEMDPGAGDRSPGREIDRRLLRLGGGSFRIPKLGFRDDGSEKEGARVVEIEEPRGGSHGPRS